METIENDLCQILYIAGEQVPPGMYRQIGGTRLVSLELTDYLPASLDGHVACYIRIRKLNAEQRNMCT